MSAKNTSGNPEENNKEKGKEMDFEFIEESEIESVKRGRKAIVIPELVEFLSKAKVGQIVKIIVKINEDITLPQYGVDDPGYWILRDTLEYTTGNPITAGIRFTKSYQSVELVYNGLNWVILNVYGATVV